MLFQQHLWPTLLLAFYLRTTFVAAEVFEECNGVADETFVASSSDCKVYIYCMGDDSLSGECNDGQYFDPTAMACDAAENVFCPLDQVATDTPEENADTELNTENTVDVPLETTTEALTTISSTTEQPLTTTSATTTTTTTPGTTTMAFTPVPEIVAPLIQYSCPENDNPQQIVFLPHNQSCSDYFVCYHSQAIEMHCPSHLHFNAASGQCDFPENAHCMISGSITEKCKAHITDFFPHPTNCNYFYYCIRGYLTVQQCPFYYGWDVERRTCVQLPHAKCFNQTF